MSDLRHKLIIGGMSLCLVVTVGSIGYYFLATIAHQKAYWSLSDCFYMTIITLTTVGFGEVIDLANVPGSRIFTVIILICGLGISAYFVSTLTAFLVEGELKNVFWRSTMRKKNKKLSDHYILVGAGRVGRHIIQEMRLTHQDFCLIDINEAKIMIKQEKFGKFPAVVGDATHDRYLHEAGVERAKGVITTLADDKDNLCIVVTCKELNPKLRIVSRCSSQNFSSKLELLGAEVVVPSFIGGLRMASQMLRPKVVKYLDRMLRDNKSVVRIEEVIVPEVSLLVNQPLSIIKFREFGNLLLLAVIKPGTLAPKYNPDPRYVLAGGDILVLQGTSEEAELFTKKYFHS